MHSNITYIVPHRQHILLYYKKKCLQTQKIKELALFWLISSSTKDMGGSIFYPVELFAVGTLAHVKKWKSWPTLQRSMISVCLMMGAQPTYGEHPAAVVWTLFPPLEWYLCALTGLPTQNLGAVIIFLRMLQLCHWRMALTVPTSL